MDISDLPAKPLRRSADPFARCGRIVLAIAFAVIASACAHSTNVETIVCVPRIESVDLRSLEVSDSAGTRLAGVFESDQEDRLLPSRRELSDAEWDAIDRRDELRRAEVVSALKSKGGINPRDLYFASVVFLHGGCPDHYRMAATLASRALSAGESDARSIYANAIDRHLVATGKPQKFGTQYSCESGECVLMPHDPTTTDEERAEYDIPPLRVDH